MGYIIKDYLVEFSGDGNYGHRVHDSDVTHAFSASEAVENIRDKYADIDGLRIERVYIDHGNAWCEAAY